jgi:hypothetical protein
VGNFTPFGNKKKMEACSWAWKGGVHGGSFAKFFLY